MGTWEGRPVQERRKAEAGKYGETIGVDVSGAESVADMSTRVAAWWKENIDALAAEASDEGPRSVLVVSHGYFISLLVRGLVTSGVVECALGVRVGRCANTSVSVLELRRDGGGRVTKFGNTSHLMAATAENDVNNEEVAGPALTTVEAEPVWESN
jgi:broad specificity phosphatase PhoE